MKQLTMLTLQLTILTVFAHGMNKPGPNGGYISMPSSFHVELVNHDKDIKIYLLDIQFKNPTVENSEVSLEFTGATNFKSSCKKEKDYFICSKPGKNLAKFNEIVVLATRAKVKASSAVYKLPLTFQ